MTMLLKSKYVTKEKVRRHNCLTSVDDLYIVVDWREETIHQNILFTVI